MLPVPARAQGAVRAMGVGSRRALLSVLAVAVLLGLGYLAGARPQYALAGAAVVAGIGIAAVDLTLLPVLAFPAILLLIRVGGGGGLSASDLVLFVASICALLQVRLSESAPLRTLIWLCIGYQLALVPTLIHNPYRANVVEWAHEAVLVGGSLMVGWVVGRQGRAHGALSGYVVLCSVLGVAALVRAPVDNFQPVYLEVVPQLIYQKNALGDLLAFAGIVAYARPPWVGWSARWANTAVACCVLGILATQSKQAIISMAAGIGLISLRGARLGRRSRVVLLSMIPLLVLAYVITAEQLSSNNQYNAAHQRLSWYRDSLDVWALGRWLGVGLRWWYTSRFSVHFQPPNAELEMLSSAGVVGLAAFVVTSAAAFVVLWRLDPLYGTLAAAVLAARLVQGQLDIFWVASQSSLPWLIVGAALGAQSLARHRAGSAPPPAGTSAPPARPAPSATPAPSGPSGR
jgi:hypothetical protein